MKPSAGPVQSLMRSVAIGACALIGAGARQGDPRPIAIVHGTLIDTAAPWFLDELRAQVAKSPTEKESKSRTAAALRLAHAKTNLKKLRDAGVLIAAGTDAPYPGLFQGEGIHRELELLVESGLTPLQAIRAATYDAARVMHAEEEWGSLEAGRRADVLVVRGSPAERISDTRQVEVVIREGQILDRHALRNDPRRDHEFHAVPTVNYFATAN